MKELSKMQKAKRYDVAIKKAKSKIRNDKDHVLYEDDIIEIFPELKESADERIKNEIISAIEEDWPGHTDWIVWLEMQGGQKPAVIIPNFRVGDIIRIKGSNAEYLITEISDGYYRGHGWRLDIIEGDKCGDYELVKQEPIVWSEEDKKMVRFIGNAITAADASIYLESKGIQVIDAHVWLEELKERVQPQNQWKSVDKDIYISEPTLVQLKDIREDDAFKGYVLCTDHTLTPDVYKRYISVRDITHQNTWKPSDEQLHYLSWIANVKLGDSVVEQEVSKHLNELYNDLKKLREE